MKDKQAETSQENVFFSRLEKERIKLQAEARKRRSGIRTDVPKATKSGRSVPDRN